MRWKLGKVVKALEKYKNNLNKKCPFAIRLRMLLKHFRSTLYFQTKRQCGYFLLNYPSPNPISTFPGINLVTLIPPKCFNNFEHSTSTIKIYNEEGNKWRLHFTAAESKRYSRIKLLGAIITKMKSNKTLNEDDHLFFPPGAVPPSLSKLDSIRRNLDDE
jgi:hypothetical protein